MAASRTPQLGRKTSSKSVPSSPDLGSRMETPVSDGVPSSSSNCSSPLFSRHRTRFSFYSQSSDNSTRPKKKGFLKIFKWFRKRGKSKDSIENLSTVTSDSITSLTSGRVDSVFVPLSRSKSADNQRGLAKSLKKTDTMKSIQLPASMPGTPVHGESSSKPVVSYTNIEEMSEDLRLAASGALRKRTAPQPPDPSDYDQVVMRNNSSSSNGPNCRLSSGDGKNPFYSSKRYSSSDHMNPFFSKSTRNSMESTNSMEGRASRTSSDSGLYARTKRKAPQPPVTNWTSKVHQLSQSKDGKIPSAESQSPSTTNTKTRSESGVSSADIGEPPSLTSTLRSSSSQSSSTLRGSLSSRCSGESLRLEKGFLKQDLQSGAGSVSRSDITSNSPNPRPWYKRIKKSKSTKKTEKLEPIDQVYEYWRPEIQFSKGKISSTTNKPLESQTATSEKSSITKKRIEVCKTKRTSQVSLLASISQLDYEAVEQLRKEKEEIKAAKDAYDDSFYKKTGPHILTQLDVSGNSPGNSPRVTSNRNCAGATVDQHENIAANKVATENRLSYSKQATLKIGEIQQPDKTNEKIDQDASDPNRLLTDDLKSWPIQQFSVAESSSTTSKTTVASTSSNQSLLQQANFDAELFYQLAKDVRHTPEVKPKNQVGDSNRLNRKSSSSSLESDSDQDSRTPRVQRQMKNFGMRMNQLFTPDVSVILEASESVTSSATTPADEALSDLNSCVTRETNETIYQDVSERGDFMSENRFTTIDAREIMQELADVRQEIERINEEENQDQLRREMDKADKIRQEVRLLRDKDNFSVWQDMLTGSSRNNASTGIPPPIDIVTPKPESKWKWVCDACTLINLPWRITCEACSSRRPTQPTRVKEDGTRVSPPKDGSNNSGSSHNSNSEGSPLTVINGEDDAHNQSIESNTELQYAARNNDSHQDGKRPPKTNWESELKHYFEGSRITKPDWNRSTNQQNSHILYNKVEEESSYGKINVVARNTSRAIPKLNPEDPTSSSAQPTGSANVEVSKPNLDELRRARVDKFEQGIRSFEAMIRGTSESTAASSNNLERKEGNDRPIANQIDTLLPQFNSTDKVFYSKEARKRPLVKTVGAVKSTISIFNQKEQLDQVKKGNICLNKQVRRKSVGLIKGQATLFENMQAEANFDLNRRKSFTKEYPRPKALEKTPEIDISSAISKFDEIAAMAEVERLNPRLVRSPFSKKPKRFIIHPQNIANGTDEVNGNHSNHFPRKPNIINTVESQENLESRVKSYGGVGIGENPLNDQNPADDVESSTRFEAEPMIMDGVLYTSVEGSGRAMSIASSTFELIDATEFEEIEAEHSQRGSPTSEYEDAFQPGYDSDGTENYVDAVPDNIDDYGNVSLLSVGEQFSGMEFNHSAEDQLDDDYMSAVQETAEDAPNSEMTELEKLSHQLTLTRGIANFKASLEAESSHLSRSSTLDISRLLKKLEAAIARGDHSEAGLLARELASLKVTCSVTHAHGGDSQEQNGGPACNQNGDEKIQKEVDRQNKSEAAENQLASRERKVKTGIKTEILRHGSQIANGGHPNLEPPVINIELTKEQITSTTVHLAVQHCHPQQDVGNSGSEETVHRRANKSTLNRREVKSDNVSKLIESSASVSTMPSIIENFNVQMYVEDRASHQGPIDVSVNASMTVGELRSKVYVEFGFPPEVQRWILGRRLADDDQQTLAQHRVTSDGCPVFLYLVAPRSSSRRDSRPLVGRRNSETLQGLPSRPKAMPPRQLSADGASSNAGPRLVSPAIAKPGYDRAAAVVRPDTEHLARQKTNAEDPIKGNELIRQQEELDMKGDGQFHKIFQPKAIAGNDANKPDSPFASSTQTAGCTKHSSNVSPTRRDDRQKPLQSTTAANQASSQENSAGVQRSTTKFAGIFSNRGSEQHLDRERRGEEGKIIIRLTEPDPSLNLRVSVAKSPQTKRKTELMPVQHKQPFLPSQQDNSHHLLAQELESEAVRQRLEHQKQMPVQQQGNSGRQEAQLQQQQQVRHQNQLSQPPRVETNKQQQSHEQTRRLLLQKQDKLVVQPLHQQLSQRHVSMEQSNAALKQEQAQTQPIPPIRLNSELQVQNPATKPQSPASVRKLTATQQPIGKGPLKNEKQVLQDTKTSRPKMELDDKPLQGVSRRQQSPLVARKSLQPTIASSNDKTSSGHIYTPGFGVPTPTKTTAEVDGWSCPRCTLVNPIQRPGCEACATERPSQVEIAQATTKQGQQSHLSRAVTALETEGAVSSRERFECRVCFTDVSPGRGVVLRDCLHTFCRECLANAVRYSDTAEVKCPYRDDQYSCDASLQEREVKELVSAAEFEKHLNKSVKQAAGSMQNVFHCKTPDCRGFCVYEDNVNIYLCTVCYKQNCLTCQAQHAGQSCRQYQEMVSLQQDIASVKTQKFFEDMIRRGDGMPCPHCSVMLVRKWGCDWMRCPMCRTEICWVTRGLRWGPNGTGDTSGGCQCGIKGRKCHPKCTYCH